MTEQATTPAPAADAFASAPNLTPAPTPPPAAPRPDAVTPPAAPEPDSMMAKIMADPTSRRAYEQMTAAKAEQAMKVMIPATEQAGTVDPAVRLQQIDYLEKHDHVRFTVENLAAERDTLRKAQADGPQQVRVLSDADTKAKLQAMDGGMKWLSEQGEGADAAMQTARAATNEVVSDMGDAAAVADFQAYVASTPEVVQVSLLAEMAQPAPAVTSVASTEQLRQFGGDDIGKQLLAEWGSEGPRKVQQIAERYRRVVKGMPPSAVAALGEWMSGLKDAEIKSIARRMAR